MTQRASKPNPITAMLNATNTALGVTDSTTPAAPARQASSISYSAKKATAGQKADGSKRASHADTLKSLARGDW
jgi:hypothetical protein